jgi:hypothetical protein
LDLLHYDPPSLVPPDSPSALPAGELRPTKNQMRSLEVARGKLSRDRATQTDTDLLCFAGIGNLDCEGALVLPRALWPGGSGFAAQGSGRALAPVHLVAPSLCPEKSGPGLCLCFLPRNFRGWPWGPAYWLQPPAAVASDPASQPASQQPAACSLQRGLGGVGGWWAVGRVVPAGCWLLAAGWCGPAGLGRTAHSRASRPALGPTSPPLELEARSSKLEVPLVPSDRPCAAHWLATRQATHTPHAM